MARDVPDILADTLDVLHAGLGTRDQVISAILLVGSNEVGVVDAGKRDNRSHLLADEGLESRLQHLGAVHGGSKIQLADVPAANDEVVGVDHGEDVVEGDVDVLAGLGVGAELHGRAHDDRAIVVGSAGTLAGVPLEAAAVGDDAGRHGGAVVAAQADQHNAELGDLAVDLEVVQRLLGNRDILAVLSTVNERGAVRVLGADLIVGVGDVGRADSEEGTGSSRSVGGSVGVSTTVGGGHIGLGVRGHGVRGVQGLSSTGRRWSLLGDE